MDFSNWNNSINIFILNMKEWTDRNDRDLRRLIKKFKSLSVADPTHDIQFAANLIEGKDGEALVEQMLKGEVKRDYKVSETGNVFVEVRSRGKESGINSTDSDYYIFVLADGGFKSEVFVGIKTSRLETILNSINYTVNGGDNKSSKGKLVPLSKLVKSVV